MLLELPIALGLIGGTLGWFGAPLLHRTEVVQRSLALCALLAAAHTTAYDVLDSEMWMYAVYICVCLVVMQACARPLLACALPPCPLDAAGLGTSPGL